MPSHRKLSLIFIYLFFIYFLFYFIFKLYIIVLVLPNIKMNPPQVYMCSPSWILLPPPSPYHPSGSSQCTSPKDTRICISWPFYICISSAWDFSCSVFSSTLGMVNSFKSSQSKYVCCSMSLWFSFNLQNICWEYFMGCFAIWICLFNLIFLFFFFTMPLGLQDLISWPGIEPGPQQWKHQIPITSSLETYYLPLFLLGCLPLLTEISVQFSSVAQSCPTLCNPMNRTTPGLPVHHKLPEFTQTHIHRVSNAIQPSHPLSSPSSPAPNPSQHQSLFQWVNSSHEVAKVLEFQLQHAKTLQSCLTLCDPIDHSPPGSPIPGILQARTLEWVAISFSNAWNWKVKVKSLSRVRPSATPWTAAY